VNRQIGVTDYKYGVLDDPLPPGHVTQCMRIANFASKMAHLHCFHPLSPMEQARSKKNWQ